MEPLVDARWWYRAVPSLSHTHARIVRGVNQVPSTKPLSLAECSTGVSWVVYGIWGGCCGYMGPWCVVVISVSVYMYYECDADGSVLLDDTDNMLRSASSTCSEMYKKAGPSRWPCRWVVYLVWLFFFRGRRDLWMYGSTPACGIIACLVKISISSSSLSANRRSLGVIRFLCRGIFSFVWLPAN